MRRLPGPADHRLGDEGDFKGPLPLVSGQAENTNSIFCDGSPSSRQQMDVRSCRDAGTIPPRGTRAQRKTPDPLNARSPERAQKSCALLLTKTCMEGGDTT